MLGVGKLDELLEIVDCAVDKDTVGVVARKASRKDSIGAGGQDQDVVGVCLAISTLDRLVVRVDASGSGVDVVVERSLCLGILHYSSVACRDM